LQKLVSQTLKTKTKKNKSNEECRLQSQAELSHFQKRKAAAVAAAVAAAGATTGDDN
jgi:hypothetical protein